jgi:hypothetical protein
MYNTSTSLNIHPHGDECPQVEVRSHDTPRPFKVFRIKLNGSEVTIYFDSNDQYDQFIERLKTLVVGETLNV